MQFLCFFLSQKNGFRTHVSWALLLTNLSNTPKIIETMIRSGQNQIKKGSFIKIVKSHISQSSFIIISERIMVWSPENWEWSGWMPCRQDVFRDRLGHHHLHRRRHYHHHHLHYHIHCRYIYIWYVNILDINISIFFRYTANSFFHSGRNAAEERFENKSQFSLLPIS